MIPWAKLLVAAVVAIGPGKVTGPPITIPPGLVFPTLVQGSEALSQTGSTFSGTVDVFLPDPTTPTPAVYLRLSPTSALVPCHLGSGTSNGADQVAALAVTCVAPSLPKLFNPVIEVQVAGSEELFLPVTLRNDTEDGAIAAWPFAFGAAAALVTLIVAFAWGRRRKAKLSSGAPLRLGDLVGVDAAWSGGDSWVTNLTTVAGVLGAILAGSGMLANFLVSVPAERFEVVLLVLIGLSGAGPVLYALFARRPRSGIQPRPSLASAHGTAPWPSQASGYRTAPWPSQASAHGRAPGPLLGTPPWRSPATPPSTGPGSSAGTSSGPAGPLPEPPPGLPPGTPPGPLPEPPPGLPPGMPPGPPPGTSQGTVFGVLVASAATLTSAYGQLVATALLIHLASAGSEDRASLYAVLGAAAIMLVVYAVRSVADVLESADRFNPQRPVSAMTHSGTISGTL